MNQIKIDYRTCFSTNSGKSVLADLLKEARFFDTDLGERDIGVENFVKMILHKTGIYSKESATHINLENWERIFVDNLFKLPVDYGKKEKTNNA